MSPDRRIAIDACASMQRAADFLRSGRAGDALRVLLVEGRVTRDELRRTQPAQRDKQDKQAVSRV